MLSLTLTRHSVSMRTPAPAVPALERWLNNCMWKYYTSPILVIACVVGCDTNARREHSLRSGKVLEELAGTWVISHRRLPDGETRDQYRIEFVKQSYGGLSGEFIPQYAPADPVEQRPRGTREIMVIDALNDTDKLVSYETAWWPSQGNRPPSVSKATGKLYNRKIIWGRVDGPSWTWDVSRLDDGIITTKQSYEHEVEQEIVWRKEENKP